METPGAARRASSPSHSRSRPARGDAVARRSPPAAAEHLERGRLLLDFAGGRRKPRREIHWRFRCGCWKLLFRTLRRRPRDERRACRGVGRAGRQSESQRLLFDQDRQNADDNDQRGRLDRCREPTPIRLEIVGMKHDRLQPLLVVSQRTSPKWRDRRPVGGSDTPPDTLTLVAAHAYSRRKNPPQGKGIFMPPDETSAQRPTRMICPAKSRAGERLLPA